MKIELHTVEELKAGFVNPDSLHVLVRRKKNLRGWLKKKVDLDASILFPEEDLLSEFAGEWRKLHSVEKAFNLVHFETRYRRMILSRSENITLIRTIKKEGSNSVKWPTGITLITDVANEALPFPGILAFLIASNIGDE